MKNKIFILLFTLIGVLNLYAESQKFYVKVSASSQKTGAGLVYASSEDKTPDSYKKEVKEEMYYAYNSGGNADVRVYLYSKPNIGYYSNGWEMANNPNKTIKVSESSNKLTLKLNSDATSEENAKDMGTWSALFEAVKVLSGTDATQPIKTSDLGGKAEGRVSFSVQSANTEGDFDIESDNSNFSILKKEFANQIVIVTVQYTDHNCHGENIEHATITLTSKGDNTSSATATINASSDLTPTFTIDNSLAFGSADKPVYVGDRQQKPIAPSSKNNVASQPAPVSQGQTGAVWTAVISGTDAAAFLLDTDQPVDGNCRITFAPSVEKENYSATLTLSVQYTDAHDNTISSAEHTVALSGVAKMPLVSKIEFTPSTYKFADMRVADATATQVVSISKQNVSNVVYSWATEYADIFRYDASVEGQITISATPAAPGNYSTTLVATGNNTLSGHTTEKTTGNLSLSVAVGLQKPTLSGSSTLDSVYLQWNKIEFADTYTIYDVNGSEKTNVTPTHSVENNGNIVAAFPASATKTYQVEAKGTYNGIEYTVWTDAVTMGGISLTASNEKYWDLYTGTACTKVEGFNGTKIKKTRVDLSHTFDQNGKALFDELYIFGETVSSDGTATIKAATTDTEGTAVTPCYVFKKAADGISYDYDRMIDIVSTGTKKLPSENTHNWTTTGSLKLYFTGWCPFGSNGKDKSDEGIIYIKGAAGTSVDIYLEDCYLYARKHTPKGNTILKDNMPNYEGESGNPSQGSASAIVVECTSNNNASDPFRISVHTFGNNILYSEMGCTAHQKVLWRDAYVGQYSSSLYIRSTSDNSYSVLNFDDKWPLDVSNPTMSCHTNGYLRFQKSSHNSPSIDIGNANTIVNFNGGQIELQNSQPAGNGYYNNTLAICHRTGKAVVYGFPLNYGYGICEDGVGGTVNFNDGSVNTIKFKPLKDEYNAYYEPLDEKGYSSVLRCPKNTYVRGGTHNSEILACSDVTGTGASPSDGICALVKADYKVGNEYVDTDTKLVKPGFYPFDKTLCTVGPQTGKTLSEYYQIHSDVYAGGKYGSESITPDADGYVHLWVPGEGRKSYDVTDWVVSMPKIVASNPLASLSGGDSHITMGGEQEVPASENDKVQNLLYAKLDSRMKEILCGKKYGMPLLNPASNTYITVKPDEVEDKYYDNITNDDSYSINQAIYYITPIMADKWYAFCPPFDVSNVYVIHSYYEKLLEQKSENDGRESALTSQATYNLDVSSIMASKIALAQGSGSSVSFATCYNAFINYAYQRDTAPGGAYPRPVSGTYTKYVPKDYTDNYVGRRLLKSFQKGQWDANYFLYKSQNCQWTFDGTNFGTDWEIAAPVTKTIGETERTVVMEAGNVYALMFPYCTNCEGYDADGIPNERTQWDYWTGKLLIMEGFGPQTIKGKNNYSVTTAPYSTPNSAVLRGNPTCAEVQVPNTLSNAWFQVDKNAFEPSNNSEMGKIPMGGVFMLANYSALSAAPAHAKAIHIRTGAVTYGNETVTTGGVPTVSGGRTLIVNSVAGGIAVVPVVPQQVGIYGSAGQLVASGYMTGETTFALPAGIYMVRGEKETAKVVIR